MNFLNRLFGRTEPTSSQVAKERLQVVLTSDRTNISPALLDILREDIIRSISEHVEIDMSGIQLSVSQGKGYHRIVADIPVLRAREGVVPRQPPRRRRTTGPSAAHSGE